MPPSSSSPSVALALASSSSSSGAGRRTSRGYGPAERRDELRLLASVLAGDRIAAERLVDRFDDLIEMSVRRVFRRGGLSVSEDEVRDAVSDVWLFLLENDMRSLRRFEPERNVRLGTWLGLLARNKTIDRLRTQHGRYVSLEVVGPLDDRAARAPTPSEAIEAAERSRLASRALAELSASDRRFIEAWYVDGREPDQLADEFGIAVGTVYSRRYKIQEKLARHIHRMTRPPLRSHRTLH